MCIRDRVDINYALTECYRVRSNSYRISHERDCISRFMGPCDVLKLLKIARAVSNVSVWSTLNVRHLNLKSNLILLLAKKLYSWFVHLIRLIIIPSQFNILTCCYFTYRYQNHQVIFQERGLLTKNNLQYMSNVFWDHKSLPYNRTVKHHNDYEACYKMIGISKKKLQNNSTILGKLFKYG